MPNSTITMPLVVQPNKLEAAKGLILQEIKSLEIRLRELQDIYSRLTAEPEAPPVHDGHSKLPSVIPDQYKGMRMTAALESYLRARPGHRISLAQVAEDLAAGGAEFGSTRGSTAAGRQQNLKIALHQLKKIVDWDDGWNLSLAPTATEAPKPRWRKKH